MRRLCIGLLLVTVSSTASCEKGRADRTAAPPAAKAAAAPSRFAAAARSERVEIVFDGQPMQTVALADLGGPRALSDFLVQRSDGTPAEWQDLEARSRDGRAVRIPARQYTGGAVRLFGHPELGLSVGFFSDTGPADQARVQLAGVARIELRSTVRDARRLEAARVSLRVGGLPVEIPAEQLDQLALAAAPALPVPTRGKKRARKKAAQAVWSMSGLVALAIDPALVTGAHLVIDGKRQALPDAVLRARAAPPRTGDRWWTGKTNRRNQVVLTQFVQTAEGEKQEGRLKGVTAIELDTRTEPLFLLSIAGQSPRIVGREKLDAARRKQPGAGVDLVALLESAGVEPRQLKGLTLWSARGRESIELGSARTTLLARVDNSGRLAVDGPIHASDVVRIDVIAE